MNESAFTQESWSGNTSPIRPFPLKHDAKPPTIGLRKPMEFPLTELIDPTIAPTLFSVFELERDDSYVLSHWDRSYAPSPRSIPSTELVVPPPKRVETPPFEHRDIQAQGGIVLLASHRARANPRGAIVRPFQSVLDLELSVARINKLFRSARISTKDSGVSLLEFSRYPLEFKSGNGTSSVIHDKFREIRNQKRFVSDGGQSPLALCGFKSRAFRCHNLRTLS
jgi:hypothetical protein